MARGLSLTENAISKIDDENVLPGNSEREFEQNILNNIVSNKKEKNVKSNTCELAFLVFGFNKPNTF